MNLRLLAVSCMFLTGFVASKVSGANSAYEDKHLEVVLRMVGHKLLLATGDSTSRVLPIVQENGHYHVRFEKTFGFNPDDLFAIVDEMTHKGDLPQDYILEVQQCLSGDVVYAFEMNETVQGNIVPCKSRALPMSCYNLIFIPSLKVKSDVLADRSDLIQESKNKMLLYIAFPLSAFLLAMSVMVYKKRNGIKSNEGTVALGNYQFDQLNSVLILKEQRIELTHKESELLMLLYGSVNEIVEREIILQEVWGDEGDYIGRTLDVFISKLRKKLDADPGVKIMTVRGVGYKLVIDPS